MSKSYAPEVRTGTDPRFYGNALRFPTQQEALDNVRDLFGRWTSCTEYRVVPCDDEPNYRWENNALVRIEAGEVT